MGRHRKKRATAFAWRWKWPLLFGGGAAALFIANAKATAAEENPSTVGGNPTLPRLPPSSGMPSAGPQFLPGTFAPTGSQAAAANSLWDTLQPVGSLDSGYINFPSGAQAAAALFPARMDEYGTYYVQWGGLTYALGSMDGLGNWSALRAG